MKIGARPTGITRAEIEMIHRTSTRDRISNSQSSISISLIRILHDDSFRYTERDNIRLSEFLGVESHFETKSRSKRDSENTATQSLSRVNVSLKSRLNSDFARATDASIDLESPLLRLRWTHPSISSGDIRSAIRAIRRA